ncbi:hypothetical protein GCM10009841_26500 [Microlunatus panaciterrae]|uniref:HEAT repeat-containing protein n=1 Tax=Microlunatus panaciterrae TaxID=400768 RepID=A0ABS2RHN1_9ACTN|nr:HEAT repeat domain-containing protein [Microlunatus panaciterrae]MBM7798467.1 hypothetical protein [Microlunatus panaciterrae]
MEPTTDLLNGALVVAAIAAVLLLVVLFTVTLVRAGRRRRWGDNREAWLATLGELMTAEGAEIGPETAAGESKVASLSRRDQVSTVSDLTGQLTDGTARRVLESGGSAQLAATAARWTSSSRWWRRLHGVRTLNLMGADEPDLLRLVDDRHPQVRAEAAAWVARHPTDAGLDRLFALLDDQVALCRFAAEDALLVAGRAALPALLRYLQSDQSARRETAFRLASHHGGIELGAVAVHGCADRRPTVRAAAAQLLTATADPRAAEVLISLLDDADPRVRSAAAHGLGALEHWQAAGLLRARLSDPVWEVSRAAAGGLRALGPAGRLYLRRATTDVDEAVAGMASHVLELPAFAVEARES